MNAIETFLDHVCDRHGTPAKLMIVNLWDSCEERLVTPADVADFLAELQSALVAEPDRHFEEVHAAICLKLSSASPRPRYLRLAKRNSGDLTGFRVRNTVKWPIFHAHLRKDGTLPMAILPKEPPTTRAAMQRLSERVAKLTRRQGWHAPDASLGRPYGAPTNCWISRDGFPESPHRPAYGSRVTAADRVRDEMGLVDVKEDQHLVTYAFSGDSLASMPDLDLARPTFADLGNRRFRTKHICSRGKHMAAAGWGCTVHLGLLPEPRTKAVSGESERVTQPLALSKLKQLEVQYLLSTTFVRGQDAHDNDEAFLRLLLRNRTLPRIKKKIVRFVKNG